MVVIKCYFFLIHVKLFGLIHSKMLKQQQQKQNVKWTSLFACYTVLLGVIWSLLLELPKLTPQSTPGYIYTKPSTENGTISTEALHFLLVSQGNRREVSQSHVIVQWKKQSIFSGLRKKKFIETASVFWTFFLGVGGYTRCTTYTGKDIGFEREHTHEETLIYFSLRARDVLLIDHQSGRLLPIHDQGKLMSTCRAKCCVCFVFVAAQTAWMYVHLRAVRVTLTAYQREGINEKMWWN